MEPEFWIKRWETGDIGFHRDEVQAGLSEFWPQIAQNTETRVFVPLCGKSLDMRWLAARGHSVLGVELSAQAVEAFFENERLEPELRREESFSVYSAGPFEIWCGDLFQLPEGVLANVSYFYDRASLVALPPDMRAKYARRLGEVLKPEVSGLLVSLSYNPAEMSGPPFSVSKVEVEKLFGDRFAIDLLSERDALAGNANLIKRGLTGLVETCYRLR
ncbi:Thiopurine S-methyltransferase [Candidatus Filomicrobium marinum]|uniref:Thiopurine S-methyltransferase n=1 Tax=Candidatus Filomicrobium marinum TaxID=1608628 RepID=A0A0D6JBI5_9HYPH|nr:thiopurine S-methyltransferase [Candidatus Filomicrobium marinum]CFX06324.1 Thiopurine S-methyltransferase [Candidatus Filomicrobium marinum]CPR16412.1 Thiopurine S-methyltransferase [Candidatus Filomicrobium marinum]